MTPADQRERRGHADRATDHHARSEIRSRSQSGFDFGRATATPDDAADQSSSADPGAGNGIGAAARERPDSHPGWLDAGQHRSAIRTRFRDSGTSRALGEAFQYRNDNVQKTELVIFIRPVVVNNPSLDSEELKHLRKFLPEVDKTGQNP